MMFDSSTQKLCSHLHVTISRRQLIKLARHRHASECIYVYKIHHDYTHSLQLLGLRQWWVAYVTGCGCDGLSVTLVDVMGSGCYGLWLWRVVTVMGCDCDGLWLWWVVAVMGCACDGLWLWWVVAEIGCGSCLWWVVTVIVCGYDGWWLWWVVAMMGCGWDGLWLWWVMAMMGCGWDRLRVLSVMGCDCDCMWLWRVVTVMGCLSIYLRVYSLHHNVLPTLQSIPLMTNGPLYPITQDSSCHGQHTMPRNPWPFPRPVPHSCVCMNVCVLQWRKVYIVVL